MKNILKLVFVFAMIFTACKSEKKENSVKKAEKEVVTYAAFGVEISDSNTISSTEMLTKFNNLKAGDTINVKFASNIKEVCSKKGCWMKLPLGDKELAMVRFKDYGFFMPLDSQGKEVIVAGKAFVKETSVEELRHYAEDAGKSKEEIAKITEPKKEFAFTAHGVLMK